VAADFNTSRFERCLSRIEDHRDWFAWGEFPLDIRRLRIGCLERLGKVPQAIQEAEDLRKIDASTETLTAFIRLCIHFGSVPRAILAGQELLERPDSRYPLRCE
jgi:hypothetical protein